MLGGGGGGGGGALLQCCAVARPPTTTPPRPAATRKGVPPSVEGIDQVVKGLRNPNGCQVPAVWYVLRKTSDCQAVRALYGR